MFGAPLVGVEKNVASVGVSTPVPETFHTPVFVLTKQVREPWERPGGTTFYFVNDGIESALRQARAVAGDRDIRIAGGANAILAPAVMLGAGGRKGAREWASAVQRR